MSLCGNILTMRFIAIIALFTGCVHQHYHEVHEDPVVSEECNYVMKLAPRTCDLDHSGERAKGAIKTWSSGETLTSSDLNANFAHIHSLMVGGHGGRLLNADVNASAAISSSKLANGLGIAKSFVFIADACAGTPCTMINAFNVSGVTRTSAGLYVATLPYTVGGSTISVSTVSGTNDLYCAGTYLAGSTVTVRCRTVGGVATDSGFTLIAFNTTP